jgi:predicted 3-demethylubiquinone-9 3-methyltransferase (glyoxalase superfamily)
MPEITPFLWFDDDLQDAVAFWAGIFPDTELVASSTGPDGRVFSGTFRLAGRTVLALNGGPGHPHTDAFSLFVDCADQAEVDRYWDALADGGTPVACGWITDRFGVSWQIVPKRLSELLGDPDRARAQRAMAAMLGMVKLDVAALEAAADGAVTSS